MLNPCVALWIIDFEFESVWILVLFSVLSFQCLANSLEVEHFFSGHHLFEFGVIFSFLVLNEVVLHDAHLSQHLLAVESVGLVLVLAPLEILKLLVKLRFYHFEV
jgi:hypothetical protein